MAITNARVKFLRGTLANLENLAVSDGNVYITTDEHAMYVDYTPSGSSTATRARIGDIIQYPNWAAIDALSAKSEQALYYAVAENILAKYSAAQQKWIQINAQNLKNIIKSMLFDVNSASTTRTVDNVSHDTQTATIQLQVNNNNNTVEFSPSFKLITDNPDSLYFSKEGSDLLMRAKDIAYTSAITTNAQNYDTVNPVTVVKLFTYGVGTLANPGASPVTAPNLSTATPQATLSIVGENLLHIKSTTTGTITGKVQLSSALAFDSTGKLTMTINDAVANTSATSANVTPGIKYGDITTPVKFVNGTATLDVYTKAQVDTAIAQAGKSMNSMIFRGTVGTSGDGGLITTLPVAANTVQIGDTYKVVTAQTYTLASGSSAPTKSARVGDMFIATSTAAGTTADPYEDSNGYIPANKIKWVHIPSGDDEKYTIKYDDNNKVVHLTADTIRKGAGIKEGSGITFTSNGSSDSQNISISHSEIAKDSSIVTTTTGGVTTITAGAASDATVSLGAVATPSFQASGNFTVLSGLVLDNGHVTGVKTSTINLSFPEISSYTHTRSIYNGSTVVTPSASAKGNTARITSTITLGSGDVRTAYSNFVSNSLTFTQTSSTGNIGIDLFWETF